MQEFQFEGYHITREGIKPLSDKVKSIRECPEPENVTQLQTFRDGSVLSRDGSEIPEGLFHSG